MFKKPFFSLMHKSEKVYLQPNFGGLFTLNLMRYVPYRKKQLKQKILNHDYCERNSKND